jgi:hypothetical protein
MEYTNQEATVNQEVFLKLSSYNFDRFAETDFLLRSGVHIQNHKSQRRIYEFIEDNIEPLKDFYERLYKAKLYEQPTADNKYFYLDTSETQNKILNKIKLDQETTLFAIFLFWLHKVEKRFSFYLTKQELIEVLNTNHKIKSHIHKLYFASEKEDTLSVQKTLENLVNRSLIKLEKLGWVYFPEDNEKFEILPAFDRIATIYSEVIYDIDNIKTNYDIQNQ